jgi:type III pantothenate kinase
VKQLLIDAGNTRLKWTAVSGGRIGRVHAAAWGARSPDAAARRAVHGRYARIVVCSVAGAAVERALRRAARSSGNPAPLFIRSARRAAGVRNGYAQTWRLGADRWVAMLGARARHAGKAVCIVDVGTALTIDLLDGHGLHRGGMLVPGPALMVDALLQSTAGIRKRAGARADAVATTARPTVRALFGRSTRAGLLAGSALAGAALIERALAEAGRLMGRRPLLLLAGGGARAVAPLLRVRHVREEHLVLHGLALLASPAMRKTR